MWAAFAFLSAFFAGVTSILVKCGIKQTGSNVATAIRTIVVLIFACIMVFIVGAWDTLPYIDRKSWMFLILSGAATGASWLCYYKALQLGDINKVVSVDKSSTVLTFILAFIVLQEVVTWLKGIGAVLISVGTFLMIQKKSVDESGGVEKKSRAWLFYALLSAVFASVQAILSKLGINGVESNLGTAIRTGVVLVMSWFMVFVTKEHKTIKYITKKELLLICLSGIATGASWLCYYKALRDGVTSAVVAIDKLSILVTVAFSYVVFKEKLTLKSGMGLLSIVGGTICMLF